jgi:hypothetical protein
MFQRKYTTYFYTDHDAYQNFQYQLYSHNNKIC